MLRETGWLNFPHTGHAGLGRGLSAVAALAAGPGYGWARQFLDYETGNPLEPRCRCNPGTTGINCRASTLEVGSRPRPQRHLRSAAGCCKGAACLMDLRALAHAGQAAAPPRSLPYSDLATLPVDLEVAALRQGLFVPRYAWPEIKGRQGQPSSPATVRANVSRRWREKAAR